MVRTVYAAEVTARARIFSYDVSLDREWAAQSALGGTAIPNEEEPWTPEHLVLAGLCRCILTSFRYHARRAGHEPAASAAGHGVVTRREEDGRFGFVEIRIDLEVTLDGEPAPESVDDLVMKGERDCFVGASLRVKPDYYWTVNGEELS
jgi:organic hydroperoxide reductase OsmC/OhrA